jgi:general secretion pathway protein H
LQGYRFLELDPVTRQWTEIFGDDIFRPRNLPDYAELELYIEGQRIELELEPAVIDEDDDRAEQLRPHVFLFSSGDMTPFELHFRRAYNDRVSVLEGDLLGKLALVMDDEQ